MRKKKRKKEGRGGSEEGVRIESKIECRGRSEEKEKNSNAGNRTRGSNVKGLNVTDYTTLESIK